MNIDDDDDDDNRWFFAVLAVIFSYRQTDTWLWQKNGVVFVGNLSDVVVLQNCSLLANLRIKTEVSSAQLLI